MSDASRKVVPDNGNLNREHRRAKRSLTHVKDLVAISEFGGLSE